MAYELELLEVRKIHNVFHISYLNKEVGQHIVTSSELPPLDDECHLVLILGDILEVRERRLRSRIIKYYLTWWKYFHLEYDTWER